MKTATIYTLRATSVPISESGCQDEESVKFSILGGSPLYTTRTDLTESLLKDVSSVGKLIKLDFPIDRPSSKRPANCSKPKGMPEYHLLSVSPELNTSLSDMFEGKWESKKVETLENAKSEAIMKLQKSEAKVAELERQIAALNDQIANLKEMEPFSEHQIQQKVVEYLRLHPGPHQADELISAISAYCDCHSSKVLHSLTDLIDKRTITNYDDGLSLTKISDIALEYLQSCTEPQFVADVLRAVLLRRPAHKSEVAKELWLMVDDGTIRFQGGLIEDIKDRIQSEPTPEENPAVSNHTKTPTTGNLEEVNYKEAYMEIATTIGNQFPECEITTLDMVRLLIHENDTLRMALKLPTRSQVLKALTVGQSVLS